jgi:hypothetical protein
MDQTEKNTKKLNSVETDSWRRSTRRSILEEKNIKARLEGLRKWKKYYIRK